MYPAENYSKDTYRKNKHKFYPPENKILANFQLFKILLKSPSPKNVEKYQKIMLTFHRIEFSTFSTVFLTNFSVKEWKTVWKKCKTPLKYDIKPVQKLLRVENL